jgi:hypothetical protein
LTKQSLAQPAQKPTTRLQRGIALAEERFEEITREQAWVWIVPSASSEHAYTVDLKHRICSCADRVPEGEQCKHEHAARYVKARTAPCAECARRYRHADLYPVGEDHLTFFEGDLLCEACSCAHGVL